MKIITKNKRAHHDYEIIDKFEAGMELLGWEVKTARANQVQINAAFCSIYKDEIYLKNANFKQYMLVKCDETRDRKLLLHKSEIRKIKHKSESLKLTIIPLAMYFNKNSKIKLEIALARGLKKHDKRDKIIQEETQKRLQKTIKNFY
ncbi:SsrA-binding protein [Mycoplasma corogypsi]|uniref:SsrA-binding protein n=1 Tax=Mycoplasma corogypsi TaxID=2106 RepID=UPI003872DDD7